MTKLTSRLLIYFSLLVWPFFGQAQQLDHSILLRNSNDPGYDISTFLISSHVNSKGNLVSVVNSKNVEGGHTKVEAPGETFDINRNENYIFETDRNGDIVWRKELKFRKLSADTLLDGATIVFVNHDADDNQYITMFHSGNVGVELDGVQVLNLQSANSTTLKLDSQGDFVSTIRSGSPARFHRLIDIKIKGDRIYFLYTRYESDSDINAECRLLREIVEVRSLDGQLIREFLFSAKNPDTTGDDICSNSGVNESFLIDELEVDNAGNVYLLGRLRGAFNTSLHQSIRAEPDEHLSILVKLNADFVFQWQRVLPASASYHNSHVVMESGDILFLNQIRDNPIYDFNKSKSEINTTNYERVFSNLTTSLTKIDPSGNLVWVSFFDRPIQIATDHSNNEQNIWVYVSTYRERSESFIYYDPNQLGHSLTNDKYPNVESQVGYLRLDEDGNYIGHRFLTLLTTGSQDSMFPTLLPLDVDCKEFYITGRFIGSVDISFEQQTEIITSQSGGDVVIAKYKNNPPVIEVDDSINEQCISSVFQLPFTVTDEDVGRLKIEVFSNNQSILPNDSLSILTGDPQHFVRTSAGQQHGSFNIIISATDECGIETRLEVPWTIKTPPPRPSIVNTERAYNLCEWETITLTASIDDPLWSNGATTKSITVDQTGLYWVNAVDASGCISMNSDTVDVFIFRTSVKPTITSSGPTTVCEGETVTLTTNLDRNIIWSTGETTPSITVSTSGNYTVFQRSSRCGDGLLSDPIEVIVHPTPDKPIIQLEGNLEFCEGQSVRLTAPTNQGVRWSTGSTDQSIEVNASGKYWLQIETNGCLSPVSDTLEVMVAPDFDLRITTDTTICTGHEEIELTPKVSDPEVEFRWSDGSDLSSLLVTEKGEYWLEASRGICTKDRIFIKVDHACFPRLYVPNAFTPNNDGVNDSFEVKGIRMTSFNIQIFDKWGVKLFESGAIGNQWDGTYKGKPAPSGSYTFLITYTGENVAGPTEFAKRGSFRIIR